MMHKSTDVNFMKKALKLARKGLFTVAENPRVGCLIVQGDEVVGSGHHQFVGQPHAEALALAQAGELAHGATAYVTLEPCSHQGKNPPCADALIAAGVRRVVVCNDDPNPLVRGQGYEKLRAVGIEVVTGVLADKGEALNAGFLHRMITGKPWVRLKLAQSLDGRTAMANGDSFWITGRKARKDVQYWRARSGAVVTGVGTVLADDCRLDVRVNDLPEKFRKLPQVFDTHPPLRVVLDTQLKMPPSAKIIGTDGACVVFTASNDAVKIAALENKGVRVIRQSAVAKRIDVDAVIDWLGQQNINEVLFECGATLAGALVSQKLVDEFLLYTAPVLMGSQARPLLDWHIDAMDQRMHLDVVSMKPLGRDWRMVARPVDVSD